MPDIRKAHQSFEEAKMALALERKLGWEKAVDLILEYLKLRFDLDIIQLRNQESQI